LLLFAAVGFVVGFVVVVVVVTLQHAVQSLRRGMPAAGL
jgi:hypothetical protein